MENVKIGDYLLGIKGNWKGELSIVENIYLTVINIKIIKSVNKFMPVGSQDNIKREEWPQYLVIPYNKIAKVLYG